MKTQEKTQKTERTWNNRATGTRRTAQARVDREQELLTTGAALAVAGVVFGLMLGQGQAPKVSDLEDLVPPDLQDGLKVFSRMFG